MKIEKIESSNTIEPGQLLIASNSWRWFGSDASLGSIGNSRLFQFYRHRQDPVPRVHRSKLRRIFRRPRTTNERRTTPAIRTSRQFLEVHGAVFKLRGKRRSTPCRAFMMTYGFGINEAGKNIVQNNGGAEATLIGGFTVPLLECGCLLSDRHKTELAEPSA